jgi:hypothetical protein
MKETSNFYELDRLKVYCMHGLTPFGSHIAELLQWCVRKNCITLAVNRGNRQCRITVIGIF